jgi:hypothetical protein
MGLRPAPCERHGAAEVEKTNRKRRREWEAELAFDAMMDAYHESVSREGYEAHLKEVIRDEHLRRPAKAPV